MVRMTQSLQHWLCDNGHLQEMVLIGFGHLEYFTEEMQKEYLNWCQTEEGKKYLEGGSEYKNDESEAYEHDRSQNQDEKDS